MAEESDLEKTEPASARRIEQAREEGNVPQSRELSTFLVLISGVVGLWAGSQWFAQRISGLMREGLTLERQEVLDPQAMLTILNLFFSDALVTLLPLFAVLIVAAFAAPLSLGGLLFSSKAITPNFSRLNPLSGVKRIISVQGMVELVKGLLKSVLVGGVSVWMLWGFRGEILALMSMPLDVALTDFGRMLMLGGLAVAGSLVIVAGIDVPFQLWQYYRKLRMTKEELKQENKQQEGDPQLKARIRARQREMARRRMMDAVPKADVVVTNPTHFAVALKYDSKNMGAPTVVAKGADLIAHAIRELASEHRVPLLEAPPLARALYRHAEIGQQIPAALYTAVAEVMAYVYQLNHFMSEGGLPPEAPHSLPVPEGMDPGVQR